MIPVLRNTMCPKYMLNKETMGTLDKLSKGGFIKPDSLSIVEFTLPVTATTSPHQPHNLESPQVPRLVLPPAQSRLIAENGVTSVMASNNFQVLNYRIDYVFKDLDPYLGIPELGTALDVFKECLTSNKTPESRLQAIRRVVNHDVFISASSNRYDRLYSIIRPELAKYGVDCSTKLANSAPVWKSVVMVI